MKIIIPLITSMLLVGCSTTQPTLIKTQHDSFNIPEEYYSCPVSKIPKSESLSDIEVSNLIVDLYRNNKTCKISIESIRKYIDSRKSILESNKQ